MTLTFSRIISNLGIKIRNMPPLHYTTVAHLRRAMRLTPPPDITPRMIWKSRHNCNRKVLGCFSYLNDVTECLVMKFQ